MKKLMMVAAATFAAWSSWGAESISVDEVSNHYPWDGKVDCVVTLTGADTGDRYFYDGVFQLSVKRGGEVVRKVVTNDLGTADGTYTNTFDCTELFGAGYYPNGGISVALVKRLDGVQLWADGPYFATCNVGATRPQDNGYYFWWGDTVGYKRNEANTAFISVKDGTEFLFRDINCPTYKKDIASLKSAGWIDANNVLMPEHDAATVHWGTRWRMMTGEDLGKLVDSNYCTWTWTTDWKGTGVAGCVVTGVQDGYTGKSIFLPAPGRGQWGNLLNNGVYGNYWSSMPSSNFNNARTLVICSTYFSSSDTERWPGQSVRPVRSAE